MPEHPRRKKHTMETSNRMPELSGAQQGVEIGRAEAPRPMSFREFHHQCLENNFDSASILFNRLDSLSDKIFGPEPREVSNDPETPVPDTFIAQCRNLDARTSTMLDDCKSILTRLETEF